MYGYTPDEYNAIIDEALNLSDDESDIEGSTDAHDTHFDRVTHYEMVLASAQVDGIIYLDVDQDAENMRGAVSEVDAPQPTTIVRIPKYVMQGTECDGDELMIDTDVTVFVTASFDPLSAPPVDTCVLGDTVCSPDADADVDMS